MNIAMLWVGFLRRTDFLLSVCSHWGLMMYAAEHGFKWRELPERFGK